MNKELKAILADKEKAIADKLATVKFSDGNRTILSKKGNAVKGKNTSTKNDVTIIGNTYNWMDSHYDVHLEGSLIDECKDASKVFHLTDHEFKITAQVGYPKSIYEKDISWEELGIEKEGSTEALFMNSELTPKYNKSIYDDYLANNIQQHSVGMWYVDLKLAVNDSEYKEEKAEWDTYFPLLGNPEKAEEKGYFWTVHKFGIREISSVLAGSNSLTPTYDVGGKNEPTEADIKDITDYAKSLFKK